MSPQIRIINGLQFHALIAAGGALELAIVAFIEYTVLGFEDRVLVGMVCHIAPPSLANLPAFITQITLSKLIPNLAGNVLDFMV